MLERVKVLQRLAEKLCKEFIVDFAKLIPNISDELMEKIRNTDASNPDFYEARERAVFIEQKKIKAIEDRKDAEFQLETEKLKEEFEEEKREIARKMLAKGMDAETVAEMTELSGEEVEKLK